MLWPQTTPSQLVFGTGAAPQPTTAAGSALLFDAEVCYPITATTTSHTRTGRITSAGKVTHQ